MVKDFRQAKPQIKISRDDSIDAAQGGQMLELTMYLIFCILAMGNIVSYPNNGIG